MKTAIEIVACALILVSCLAAAIIMAGGSILLTAFRKFESKEDK